MASTTQSPKTRRQSKFLEDITVGGQTSLPNTIPDDQTPIVWKITSDIKSLTPLKALKSYARPQSSPPYAHPQPAPKTSSPPPCQNRPFSSLSAFRPHAHLQQVPIKSSPPPSPDKSFPSLKRTRSEVSIRTRQHLQNATKSIKKRLSTDSLRQKSKHEDKLVRRIKQLEAQVDATKHELGMARINLRESICGQANSFAYTLPLEYWSPTEVNGQLIKPKSPAYVPVWSAPPTTTSDYNETNSNPEGAIFKTLSSMSDLELVTPTKKRKSRGEGHDDVMPQSKRKRIACNDSPSPPLPLTVIQEESDQDFSWPEDIF